MYFVEAFVNATGVPVELYACDGSVGAAIGAGIGAGAYSNEREAFTNMKRLRLVEPTNSVAYDGLYTQWKELLEQQLKQD
jgi:xylulokinase